MPNFGYDVIGGSTDATAENWNNEAMVGAALRYTASSGDTVTRVEVYGDGTGDCEVGVYTFSGGVPVTKVGSAAVSVGSGAGWHGTDVSWALTNGVVYVVALEYQPLAGGSWNIRYDASVETGNTSISSNQGALAATWSQSSTSAAGTSMRAIVTSGAAADAPWMRVPRFHQAGLWMPRGRGRNKRSR